MSVKLHFLQSFLDYFPKNCGDFKEEQGERFHQDIRIKELRYQGRWDVNFLADNYWCLKQDAVTIFTNPSTRVGYDTRSVFKRSLTGLNSEFSFSYTSCLTKAEEPSLPYYLPIEGGRMIGFIPFPRSLVLCEMQSITSRIWTRTAVSITYDDNHYTTSTS